MYEGKLRGMALLNDPTMNRGTAFTKAERAALGLHGLLPPHIETLDEQVVRAYGAYQQKDNDLERHIYLRALQDTNEVLFYRLLLDHIAEMMPIVYTPVVAQGCQEFSHIYRRPRGMFVSFPLRDAIPTLLRNRPNPRVDVMVVTDGERVLGIGDQGVGGLGIPIGKLSLYTLIGGIHPSRTLPIILDVGTNNQELLADPEYLGWRHERITGAVYADFIEQFVHAVRQELPATCLQWEDFATRNARPILDRYRDQLLTFNDDIQGTASVTLGAILGALGVIKKPLREQQIVFLGAGSASIGVADYLRAVMVSEGLSEAEARARFWILNSKGLLRTDRENLTPEQEVYAQPAEQVVNWTRDAENKIGLAEVISNVPATILIGLSTVAGAFRERIIREMARKCERPIIFPLSNPTDRAEAKPADLLAWTDGRALIATGSPFPPVKRDARMIRISQCNNVYIFPAVGLGIVASRAKRVTDSMMLAAAKALAGNSPALRNPSAPLLPEVAELRNVAAKIALAVANEAQHAGVAEKMTPKELRARIAACQWTPAYEEYPALVS